MTTAVPAPSAAVALRPLPVAAATITGGLWRRRMTANHAAIPAGHRRLTEVGTLGNVRHAAHRPSGATNGQTFADSDLYKWLEAAAWESVHSPDEGLRGLVDEVVETLAAAQAPDGYLNTAMQVTGEKRYTRLGTSHELYCAGHLFQAAVAQARATGGTGLLDIATRFADHLAATFGPGRRPELDGHPVVEMALVELYRETGTTAYLDLARHFVDTRGFGHATPAGANPDRYVDHEPVRSAGAVVGHAVRAVYFATGATDVAIETGDTELLAAVRRQYDSMTREKQYITGGVGARWDGEAFGDAYELPPDRAYAETCAAIGTLQWAWRLLLATGEARYADDVERLLYNAVLPGVSLGGAEYFYANVLQLRTGARPDVERHPANGRRAWFNCSCCPPNVMRTLAGLPSCLATGGDDGLQLHLYAPGTLRGGGLVVDVETEYPWAGRIAVTVREAPDERTELALRVPAWAEGATLDGAPVPAGAYARVRRRFEPGERLVLELPMAPRLLRAHDRVDAVRGCVAVARGPVVYALEQPDQEPGAVVEDLRIDPSAPVTAERRPDLLDDVTVLHTSGVTLIPYFAWANRGTHAMRVWVPTS